MKKIKYILICSLFIFLQCNGPNRKLAADKEQVQEGITVSEEQIEDVSGIQLDILGWYGIPNGKGTAERYQMMKQAGFTHNLPSETAQSHDENTVLAELDNAHAAGMKMLVYAPMMDRNAAFVKNVTEHPANGGYVVQDEPHMQHFAALEKTVKKIQAIDSKNPCYINHLPWGATETGYQLFIQTFLETVPVTFLSFDAYPVHIDENGQRYVSPIIYNSLEVIAAEAKRANMPFWAFALATKHGPYPSPTLDDLRLQVYSNLAYGAQCVQYFTYWTPPDDLFITGPLDKNGQATDTYGVVKAMNSEIIALSKVFRNAKVLTVMHTGAGALPEGAMAFDAGKLPAAVKSLEVTGGDNGAAVVSILEKGADMFFMVVNRSINNNMNVKIEGTDALRRVKKDGTAIMIGKGVKSLGITPGDALIYFWKK